MAALVPDHLVAVGVDTHADFHVAVAGDQLGRVLDTVTVPTTKHGYASLLAWALEHGTVVGFGVEGTGSWGAGLARYLLSRGQRVVEVHQADRALRRRRGKSDALDAEAAMRAVLGGHVATPKRQDGTVEMIRALRVARRSAMLARIQAGNQLHGLLARAPEELRTQLRGLRTAKLATTVAAFRPGAGPPTTVVGAAKVAMRELGRRYLALQAEINRLEEVVQPLVGEVAPGLLALPGVGPETAAALLEAAGDNPERLTSEAAFALLCGVAPLPASSGKITRHRVNPGGNRQANEALWRIVLVRMKCHLPTRAYVERRTKEGLSKPEIMRCLKRYVAREVYRHLRPRPLSPKGSSRL